MSREKGLWISFGGVDSDEQDIRVAALPEIPIAAARGAAVEIPGRDGTLWLADETFDDVTLEVELEFDEERLDDAARWLSGKGELILSSLEEFCWRARVERGIALKPGTYAGGRLRGTAAFVCQPFRYRPGRPAMAPITAPKRFSGQGTWPARPVITVHGSGDIHLMLNGATVLFTGVDGRITLDCEAMMAFRDGVNASGQVSILSDDDAWPVLSTGQNSINWSGAVEKIVIVPNWRWR